jgi:uncharacterized protein YqjF (DUF2071 family)
MSRPFLTARWEHLILFSYAVPDELLRPRLPPGLEPDTRDGKCFVSLVPFLFNRTRVFGVGWPGYRRFPEVNLRMYVRHGDRRGVCFIREYVPKRLVAWAARRIYNEPYRRARMSVDLADKPGRFSASYAVTLGDRVNRVWALGDKDTVHPGPDSVEHFFKEHQWGFGRTRDGRLLTYEVKHPEWEVFPVIDYGVDIDWALMYGPEWRFLQDREPDSIVFAVGSDVAVYPKSTYETVRALGPSVTTVGFAGGLAAR